MRFICTFSVVCFFASLVYSDDPLFSGPQVGEALAPFQAQLVFGDDAGKKTDVLEKIETSPTLLVFVHQVTRPSIGLARLLMNYANTKQKVGLNSRLVFLSADSTDTQAWLRRARHALPKDVSPLVSTDGIEGPGVYGLNRKVTLTVLVANEGTVTANFPLIQPSIQADAVKIGSAIVKALGGDATPTLKEMGFEERKMRMRKPEPLTNQEGVYRQMMSPVIQKNATSEQVTAAAEKVEEMAAKQPWFRARVHKASNLIVNGGKLSNYGTAEAQAYLKKWAAEFAAETKTEPQETSEQADKQAGQRDGSGKAVAP